MNATKRRILVINTNAILFDTTRLNLKEMMKELIESNNAYHPNAECLTHFRHKGTKYGFTEPNPYNYKRKVARINRLHITLIPTLEEYKKQLSELEADEKKLEVLFSKIFKMSIAGYDIMRCIPQELLNELQDHVSFYDEEDYHLSESIVKDFMEENKELYSLINHYQLKNLLVS